MAEQPLHIFFFPLLAPSHMMSLADIAGLFAERGVRVSIVTTHGNAFRFRRTIEKANRSGHHMRLLLIPFPSSEVGLPEGCEDSSSIVPTESNIDKLYQAFCLLKLPFQQLLLDHRPDCIVADVTDNWCSDLGVPYVLFVPYSPVCLCVYRSVAQATLSRGSSGNSDASVVVDGLPHRIQLARSEIPGVFFHSPEYLELCQEAERKSCGMVANSFYELTPEYVDHYGEAMGGERKLWCVGPLFLINKMGAEPAERGGGSSNGEIWERVKTGWLDLQPHGSVVYVCFGSEYGVLSHDQCREIAVGLESSGHPFVWVVKEVAEWLPDDFEDRVRGRGLIWRGWAPQLRILSHPAIGGFVTHCGWNSIVEAVSFGVPMIGWPLRWDQFVNERLVVEVLGIGIRVLEGAARTVETEKETVEGETVRCAVKRLMGGGEEASIMKKRVNEYKAMARSAVEEGGSSHANLSRLIEKLTIDAREKRNNGTP